MLDQVFRMQRELNMIIGRDTVGASQEERDSWLFGYAFACVDEFYELEDSLDDKANAKIEIIDVMHFVVSMYHILNIQPEDLLIAPEYLEDTEDPYAIWSAYGAYNSAYLKELHNNDSAFTVFMRNEIRFSLKLLNTIMRNVDWKWWSKTVKEDPSRQFKVILNRDIIITAAKELFTHIVNIFSCLDMTSDVFDVYRMKWEKNIARQNNDYDVRTKTEEDNQEIIQQINSNGGESS